MFFFLNLIGIVGIGLEIWLPNGWRIGGRSTHADRHSYMALVAEGLPTHATTGLTNISKRDWRDQKSFDQVV